MKKTIYGILIIVILCGNVGAQKRNLQLYLENAPFDSLYLYDVNKNYREVKLWGEKTAPFFWEFTVPDSVPEFAFASPLFQSIDTIYRLGFTFVDRGDTVSFPFITVDEVYPVIYAKFHRREYTEKVHTVIKKQGLPMLHEAVFVGDIFEVTNKDGSDIFIRTKEPFFSMFLDRKNEKTYNDFLEEYISLSKEYPNSKYLIYNLSRTLTKYKSRNDIMLVYNNLSEKYKSSQWGKKIERFLRTKFENISLPAYGTNRQELVVQDNSKYNLIMFTASWCKPCIEEIPLLKQMYNDLHENLIITYISIDEENSVKSFEKLMEREKIPWRALLAYENIKNIKEQYTVEKVPYGILVFPNGNMEPVEIRDEELRQAIYLSCGKKEKHK